MLKSDSPVSGKEKTNGQETEKENGIFKCLISSISRLYPLTILIIFLHIAMFFNHTDYLVLGLTAVSSVLGGILITLAVVYFCKRYSFAKPSLKSCKY